MGKGIRIGNIGIGRIWKWEQGVLIGIGWNENENDNGYVREREQKNSPQHISTHYIKVSTSTNSYRQSKSPTA